jgi:hypothetical protein
MTIQMLIYTLFLCFQYSPGSPRGPPDMLIGMHFLTIVNLAVLAPPEDHPRLAQAQRDVGKSRSADLRCVAMSEYVILCFLC